MGSSPLHGRRPPGQPRKQLALENEFRKTLTQIVLSIFGLFILYFTWQRARTGDKTVQIMEQGHITDRYTKAIEQLGKLDNDKPNIEVRLGAIYALERIAHDSPRDHWTIMEVLTVYVRQNAPAARLSDPPETPPRKYPPLTSRPSLPSSAAAPLAPGASVKIRVSTSPTLICKAQISNMQTSITQTFF